MPINPVTKNTDAATIAAGIELPRGVKATVRASINDIVSRSFGNSRLHQESTAEDIF